MTQRERHTPEGGALPVADTGVSCLLADLSGASTRVSLWEDWFRRASTVQQQDVLALAAQQGVLYAAQLTAVPTAPPERSVFPSLLNGHLHDLLPHRPKEIELFDTDLDAAQRQAVARADSTPDICLIEGYPGTGKSRVLAEIIRQASRRGERILLQAPTASAIDCILERLACGQGILAVRHLAADEKVEALSPCVRRQTVAERLRSLRDETLPAAREAASQATAAHHRRLGQRGVWPRLEELARQAEELTAKRQQVQERQANVATAVESDLAAADKTDSPSPFQAAWSARRAARDEAVTRLVSQQTDLGNQAQETEIGRAHV